jgi:hypothetical protein
LIEKPFSYVNTAFTGNKFVTLDQTTADLQTAARLNCCSQRKPTSEDSAASEPSDPTKMNRRG